MNIDKDFLVGLRPCSERWSNFVKNYHTFSGSMQEFLALDKISYSDKAWVVRKTIPRKVLVLWAAKCAESVLPIFEKKYPENKSVRECIEAVFDFIAGKITIEQLLDKRHAAAADAAAAAAADRIKQQEKNIEILIELLNQEEK